MSELSDGGESGLGEWGYGVALYNLVTHEYDNGGMGWQGDAKATPADMQQCRDAIPGGDSCKFNHFTLCGKADPAWTTWADENRDEYPYEQSIKL